MASSVAVQTSRIAEFLATGENVPRMGSANTATVPHRAFLCQDKRWLAVGVITDAQWRGLCKAISAPELLEDSRFSTNPGRVKHRDELEDRLGKIFSTNPAPLVDHPAPEAAGPGEPLLRLRDDPRPAPR